MKARGKFKFKELRKVNAGTFINNEGKEIPYNASYKLVADEIDNLGIHERIFKLDEKSELVSQLQKLEPYTDIVIEFDVQNFASGIRLLPVAIGNPSK